MRNSIPLKQISGHGCDIARKTGVIQNWGQSICPAAVTLIHAHHVHPCRQRFVRDAQHVLRFARTFKAVDGKYGQNLFAVVLPMALAKNFDVGLDLYKALFRRRKRNFSGQEKRRRDPSIEAEEASRVIKEHAAKQRMTIRVPEETLKALIAEWQRLNPKAPAEISFQVGDRVVGSMKIAACAYFGDTCCA